MKLKIKYLDLEIINLDFELYLKLKILNGILNKLF